MPGKDWMGSCEVHGIPSHVRHLQTVGDGESAHRAGKNAEARGVPLLRLVEYHLAADADAECFASRGDIFLQGAVQARPAQLRHRRRRLTDTGEDDPFGIFEVLRDARGEKGRAKVAQRILHALQIPRPIVDDDRPA